MQDTTIPFNLILVLLLFESRIFLQLLHTLIRISVGTLIRCRLDSRISVLPAFEEISGESEVNHNLAIDSRPSCANLIRSARLGRLFAKMNQLPMSFSRTVPIEAETCLMSPDPSISINKPLSR